MSDPFGQGGGGVQINSVATERDGNWSATSPDDLTRFDVTAVSVDSVLNSSEMARRPRVVLPMVISPQVMTPEQCGLVYGRLCTVRLRPVNHLPQGNPHRYVSNVP